MTVIPTAAASPDMKAQVKQALRAAIPLSLRKALAVWLQRVPGVNAQRKHWWSVELVRDLAEHDINRYHEFLWTHHLGYALTYEVASRFGPENMRASRRMFFDDLAQVLEAAGLPGSQVQSVFEIGCSLGYQLRYMETDFSPRAAVLDGVDIDRYAVEAGGAFLKTQGSKVALRVADMRDLEQALQRRTYDVIICTGVLMYLTQAAAAEVVGVALRHARVVAMAGLAHPAVDNAALGQADTRASDSTFVHNLDAMVTSHGGRILSRRWEGARDVDGNTIYFVFAEGSGAC